MTLEAAMKKLYDKEVNVRIQCCWDAGWYVYFQDPITHKWARKTYCVEIEDIKTVLLNEARKL